MADVHQCPHCELKFLHRTELEQHWAEDHPAPVEVEGEGEGEGEGETDRLPEDPA